MTPPSVQSCALSAAPQGESPHPAQMWCPAAHFSSLDCIAGSMQQPGTCWHLVAHVGLRKHDTQTHTA